MQINASGVVYLKHFVPPTPRTGGPAITTRIELTQAANGQLSIKLNGTSVAEALQLELADVGGSVAVHATAGASVHVTEMHVNATANVAQRWLWLTASDGVTGGAMRGWLAGQEQTGSTFHSGQGFTSLGGNTTLAKWNFVGVAARLWLPKGPGFGTVSVSVDGQHPTIVDLHAAQPAQSAAVFEWHETPGYTGRVGVEHGHALIMRWVSGGMVADSVEFLPASIGTRQFLPASIGSDANLRVLDSN